MFVQFYKNNSKAYIVFQGVRIIAEKIYVAVFLILLSIMYLHIKDKVLKNLSTGLQNVDLS